MKSDNKIFEKLDDNDLILLKKLDQIESLLITKENQESTEKLEKLGIVKTDIRYVTLTRNGQHFIQRNRRRLE